MSRLVIEKFLNSSRNPWRETWRCAVRGHVLGHPGQVRPGDRCVRCGLLDPVRVEVRHEAMRADQQVAFVHTHYGYGLADGPVQLTHEHEGEPIHEHPETFNVIYHDIDEKGEALHG